MVGIVIVSHSWKIAEGICDLAREMAPEHSGIIPAGGLEDGTIGTDATRIMNAILEADSGDGVVIIADIGSSIMSAETAIELLQDEESDINVKIADTPIVEGTICAAVEAAGNSSLDDVLRCAEEARGALKL